MPVVGTLLTTGNPKTAKGEGKGYFTAVLHLSPADSAGVGNLCPWADACRFPCLNTAGRGGIMAKGADTNAIQEARKARTILFMRHRAEFRKRLAAELVRHARTARAHGLIPAFRFNGTSDVNWTSTLPEISALCDDLGIAKYDYTKDKRSAERFAAAPETSGRFLTYSRTEHDDTAEIVRLVNLGVNVAVVFGGITPKGALPLYWQGMPVVDGDADDLRFLDASRALATSHAGPWAARGMGLIVGLRAKGRAKKDRSGFVVARETSESLP
jgi:hypothetical protein